MNYKDVETVLSGCQLNQFSRIPLSALVIDDEVRKICESNGCGNYGKTWGCPPGVGPISDWKAKMLSFDNAVMFNYVGSIEDSFDFEGMQDVGKKFSEIIKRIKSELSAVGGKYMLFGAGSCSLCKTCTYPDAPCRNPDKFVPSMEACGLYVAKMAEPCGFKYINGANTVTYFGLILY